MRLRRDGAPYLYLRRTPLALAIALRAVLSAPLRTSRLKARLGIGGRSYLIINWRTREWRESDMAGD